MENQLQQYVKEARGAGLSPEQISQSLLAAGWKMPQIIGVLSGTSASLDIVAEHVSKSYGAVKALDNVSITVPSGSVLALLGPNGAGKTTLVRILATLLKPDTGDIHVAGYDVSQETLEVRKTIGLTGQYAAVDEYLTGFENLVMIGKLYHLPASQARSRARELLQQFDLEDAMHRPAKTYSGGMRRRLDIAASLINTPKVLFLDEPTTGLDPQSRLALWAILKELVKKGTTILLTTQYLEEADHLADGIVVMNHGRVIAQGTAHELKTKFGGDVVEIHLKAREDAVKAVAELTSIAKGDIDSKEETGVIIMPVHNGPTDLIETVRILDRAKIAISDITLRRPTLDDVFLKLTGKHTA